MKNNLFLLILCCFFFLPIQAKKEKDAPLKYEIECAGSGVQGTYLVNVSVHVGKKEMNQNMIKRAAVHGVIFRGFTGDVGCIAQKAMAKSPMLEQEKAPFFQLFFEDNGQFMRYAKIVEGTFKTVGLAAKKEYLIQATVSVQKDQLRKDLESAGVIQSLSSGF